MIGMEGFVTVFVREGGDCRLLCFTLVPFSGVMGCGAAEATGLGFVCFVVINPRVLSSKVLILGLFLVS